jgi:hypothetical protein
LIDPTITVNHGKVSWAEGLDVLGGRPPKLASFREVIAAPSMERTAVIPHHQIVNAPLMGIDKIALRRMLQEVHQKHAPFSNRPANNLPCVDADK